MNDTIQAEWSVDQWEAGSPNHTEISADQIAGCQDVAEAMKLIEALVRDDFEQTIRWYFENSSELQKWVADTLASQKQADEAEA